MRTCHIVLLLVGLLAHGAPAAAQSGRDGGINLLPQYGGVPKSKALRKADERFLAFCDQNFASRTEAAAYHANKGWDFLRRADPTTAIKRFNQAWLLDSTNAMAYWGFGAICGQRGDYTASLHYFQLTTKHDASNRKVLVDIGETLLRRFQLTRQPADLDNAVKSLQFFLADSHDSFGNFEAYEKLMLAYLLREDYANAWNCVDLATVVNPLGVQKWASLAKLQRLSPRN